MTSPIEKKKPKLTKVADFTKKVGECRAAGLHCTDTEKKKSGGGLQCGHCHYGTCAV